MMLVRHVIWALLVSLAAADHIDLIETNKGFNVSLPCNSKPKPGVDYRACRWYKEGVDPRLTGLVSRTPPGGMLRWYVDADTRISLEYPSLSLLLPPVSCSDAGVYQCYLAAPVGEQNREGRVILKVLDCPEEEKTPVIPKAVLKQPELLALAAGLVLFIVLGMAFGCLYLRKAKWNKAKSVDKLLYPDLAYPLEKQGLMLPTFSSQNPKPSVLNF